MHELPVLNFNRRFREPLILLLVTISFNVSCSTALEAQNARESAKTVHDSLRARNYEAIYSNASQRFKTIRTKNEYVSMMKEIDNEYGKLISVKEEGAASLVNTDVGKMEVLVFALEFEKAKATERLTFIRDNGGQMRLWMFELS